MKKLRLICSREVINFLRCIISYKTRGWKSRRVYVERIEYACDKLYCTATLLIDVTYAHKISRVSGYYEVAWFNTRSRARTSYLTLRSPCRRRKRRGRRKEERGWVKRSKERRAGKRRRMMLNESNYETSFNYAVGGQCVILHCAPLSSPF